MTGDSEPRWAVQCGRCPAPACFTFTTAEEAYASADWHGGRARVIDLHEAQP